MSFEMKQIALYVVTITTINIAFLLNDLGIGLIGGLLAYVSFRESKKIEIVKNGQFTKRF